jgi:hypothetical protein
MTIVRMVDQAKKACIRIPAPAVRNGSCGLDVTYPRHFSAVRYRGRDINATISLLERR